jgi:hypothetical protein
MIEIILGILLLIGVGVKIYLRMKLQQFDGVGEVGTGNLNEEAIHLGLGDGIEGDKV